MPGGDNEVVVQVAGISAMGVVLAALISRLKRKKTLLLEDKRDEVRILAEVVQAMDLAMTSMRTEYDDKLSASERHKKECDEELAKLNKKIDEWFKEPIPAYTQFKRMGVKKDEG